MFLVRNVSFCLGELLSGELFSGEFLSVSFCLGELFSGEFLSVSFCLGELMSGELLSPNPHLSLIAATKEICLSEAICIENYSNFLKLIRIMAYVLRFISKLKGIKVSTSIQCTGEELREAKFLLIKENQRLFKLDRNFKELSMQLNIREDDKGILRVNSRLNNSHLPLATKNPIVLKRDHYLCTLFILYYHTKVLHNGLKQTITGISTCFYIPKMRQLVRKLLNKCLVCRRLNVRKYRYPGTGDLPGFRMDNSRVFKNVGVDYLGPLFVLPKFKPGNQLFKVWVVLYTCASTRGIVLDVVDNMSSNAFLNSLRKFIARRGAPSLFVSDNGTSFKAIETQNFIATREITWKFNLEAAPWWGGFWERLVALVKACLKKAVGHKRLTYVELVTFLQEVECVLNIRPLCEP